MNNERGTKHLLTLNLRAEEDGMAKEGMETIYRRDRKTELKTLNKMTQIGDRHGKRINGMSPKGNSAR